MKVLTQRKVEKPVRKRKPVVKETKPETAKPKKVRRKASSMKAVYVAAGIWDDHDGAGELVVNATWHDTLKEAQDRAMEWATNLYDEWFADMQGSPFFDSGSTFDDAWVHVDNGDREFMDWGYDPVDNQVASIRIRVFKAYRGA